MNYILHVTTCTCTCTYYDTLTYMYCTALDFQLPAGSVHELSSSIQLEVSYVVIVGRLAQMGSVSPF